MLEHHEPTHPWLRIRPDKSCVLVANCFQNSMWAGRQTVDITRPLLIGASIRGKEKLAVGACLLSGSLMNQPPSLGERVGALLT